MVDNEGLTLQMAVESLLHISCLLEKEQIDRSISVCRINVADFCVGSVEKDTRFPP